MSAVNTMLECPSMSCTTFQVRPAAQLVAQLSGMPRLLKVLAYVLILSRAPPSSLCAGRPASRPTRSHRARSITLMTFSGILAARSHCQIFSGSSGSWPVLADE